MVLLLLKSLSALPVRPPLTVRFGSALYKNMNRFWVSAFARSVPPEVALPIVRPFARTQPLMQPVPYFALRSPLEATPVVSTPAAPEPPEGPITRTLGLSYANRMCTATPRLTAGH
jgi:hypothetical protein